MRIEVVVTLLVVIKIDSIVHVVRTDIATFNFRGIDKKNDARVHSDEMKDMSLN